MIVDCHGHYTTAPQALWDWRKAQLSQKGLSARELRITDDEIRESLEKAQLRLAMAGDDLVALVDGELHFARAWGSGRVRLAPSTIVSISSGGIVAP